MADTTDLSLSPVQTAVTGSEFLGERREPLEALAEFYCALNARDMALMEAQWGASPSAEMDNPLGGIRRGWDDIRAVYEKLFAAPREYRFEFWDYTLHRQGEVFWVVGRERGYLETAEGRMELAIRTSRLFRWDGVRWRQVHHHGSIEYPEMLAAYQAAVLGKVSVPV
ncbi:YybH family protein [Edaphobacter dinghuensis]|uniref:YybH family protein n=1 Tax=Edaphobacter dinghuensis TaxID=1560005 RepID=UPI00166CBB3E|nr:nuclear transport factor 2 family protein [Edaphobacter dinghuensis]